jgi:long-chain acyl-CoA synthetase
VKQINRYLRHGLPEKIPSEVRDAANDLAKTTDTANRKLRQIEEVLDLFQPFTHDNFLVFECRNFQRHSVVEPEFRFEVESIDWRQYWLEIHMPGLRRWCFPQYENKDKELYVPATKFELQDPPEQPANQAPGAEAR